MTDDRAQGGSGRPPDAPWPGQPRREGQPGWTERERPQPDPGAAPWQPSPAAGWPQGSGSAWPPPDAARHGDAEPVDPRTPSGLPPAGDPNAVPGAGAWPYGSGHPYPAGTGVPYAPGDPWPAATGWSPYGVAAPPGPQRPQLRPVGAYGEYVWWFYRRHGLLLLAIALVTSIPTLIVSIPTVIVTAQLMRQQAALASPFSADLPDQAALRALEEANRSLIAVGAINSVIGTMTFVAAGAAIAWFVREVEERRAPSLGGALDAVVDRLRPLAGMWLLLTALALVGQLFSAALAEGGALFLIEPATAVLLVLVGLLGVIAWIVVAIALAVRWSGAIPGIALDGLGTRAALGRSWRWTDGNAWRILGLFALAVLAAILVALVPVGLATVALAPAMVSGPTPLTVVAAVLNWLATAVLLPIFGVLTARVYLDLRGQLGAS